MDREITNRDGFGNEHDPLEKGLRQFAPRPSSLDRDRLMFLAGAASREPNVVAKQPVAWRWPAATFSMATVATCFALAFAWQLSRPTEVRIVIREVPVEKPIPLPTAMVAHEPAARPSKPSMSPPISLGLPETSMLQMRNVALRFGVDAIAAEQRSYTSSAVPPAPIDRWQPLRDETSESDPSL